MKLPRILVVLLVVLAATLASILSTDAIAIDLPGAPAGRDTGELWIDTIDVQSGRPLAARMRVVPRSPLRKEQVVVARDGRARLTLQAGGYHVYVTHGPEWSVSEHELQVEGSSTTKLRAPLLRQLDASAYTACDLHVHSAASPDSDLAVRERIDTLLAEDVHFAVLTDHNRVTDAQAALAGAGIASLPGVEVTTWDPEFGHFNVFPRRSPPRYRGMSAVRLLHELRQESSFVQINHPRLEHHIGYFELAAFDRESGRGTDEFPLAFDALEVWNGYELSAPERRNEVFQDWLALLARGQRITATGSSDSHRAGAAPYAGYPRTYVQVPRSRAQAPGSVLAALKQGRSFVTNGPLLELRVRDHGPGETVRLARGERSLAARVDVSAPAWMDLVEVELWLGTQRVAVAALPPTKPGVRTQRATVELELSVEREHSLLATVRGRASMKPLLGRAQVKPYAFTNPVWLARL